jgi:hypothetical protein
MRISGEDSIVVLPFARTYQINPEYNTLEAEANRLTTEIARSLDEDVVAST